MRTARRLNVGMEPMHGERAGPLFLDKARVLQQAKVPRHARLSDAEHGRQLRDVHRLQPEDADQPQPGLVAEEAQEGWGV